MISRTQGSGTFERLRTRHARFRFRDYAHPHEPEGLRFTYQFATDPDIVFRPTVRLNGVDAEAVRRVGGTSCTPGVPPGPGRDPELLEGDLLAEIVVEAGQLDA